MTHQLYWQCVAMFLFGQGLLLFWFTIPQLKEKCRIANKQFSWAEWWKCDWNLVVGNMLFGAMAILALDELLNWQPNVLQYVKWFFGIAGAFLPTIIQEKWGNMKKAISNLLDVKANIADITAGHSSTKAEAIQKAETNLGIDATKNIN